MLFVLCSNSVKGQQTHLLLDPIGAGGFELGASFEDNGWTVINETQTNQWILGAIPEWFAGNRGAYISNDNSSNTYTNNSASRVHFYRDVVFPVGVENATVSLDVNMLGESQWDNLLVYIADTNVIPSSVGPTGSTLTGWTANISTIASQVTGAVPNTTTLNPNWTNYVNGVSGFYLDAVLRLNTTVDSEAILTNLVINLTPEQVTYVSGNTKRLIITWKNDGSGGLQPPSSVDNIKIEAFVPACFMVDDLLATDVTSNSFVLHWDSDENSLGYNYEIRTSGEPGSGIEGLITEGFLNSEISTLTIPNLLGNTNYQVYIKKNCELEIGSSNWRVLSVTTLCGAYGYFEENFDTTATGTASNPSVPTCWSFIDGGVGSGYVSNLADFSVPNGFYLTNGADTTNDYLLVSPETVNLGNGTSRLRFKAKTTSSSIDPATTLKVVTLADQDNSVGMVEVTTKTLTTTFQEFIVYLPTGTNTYFAFKHGLNANSRVIYIDDVVFEPNPSCLEVNNLQALLNFSEASALVTWQNPEYPGLINNFEVQYGLENFELGEGTFQTVDTLSSTIQNLILGETYDIYVRRICGADNQSVWEGPVKILNDYCLSIPTSNDNSGISSLTMGEETFEIDDVFYEDLTDQIVAIDANDSINSSITFETGFTYKTHIWIDFNNDGIFNNTNEKVYTGESTNVNPTTLDTSFSIPPLYQSGEYRMRIGTADSGQSTPNPCYSGAFGVTIDLKVAITFPCHAPENIEATEITSNFITLNWDSIGSDFDISYGPQGVQPDAGTIIQNINKPFTLSELIEFTNYSIYIKQNCIGQESEWSVLTNFKTLCAAPTPDGMAFQTLVEDDAVSQIAVVGENLKYYLDVELTQQILPTTVLEEGYYYVTQTIGCESYLPLEVFVTLIERIDEPIVPVSQQFCDEATMANLSVQGLTNAEINWYDVSTGGSPLVVTDAIFSGTYYVNQTDGVTTSHRVAVEVVVNETPVNLETQEILVCGYANFASIEVGQQENTTVKWYASLNDSTPINNTQQTVSGIYYVTQSNGICESEKIQIELAVFEGLSSPVAPIQTFCGSGTVSDLVAQAETGAELNWYTSSISTVKLSPSTILSSGTYYVEQTKNGCVSPRRAVAVRVVSLVAPQVSPITICKRGIVADLYIPSQSGVTYKWYSSPNSQNALAQDEVLQSGTYYVARVHYGCESVKTAVQVSIIDGPSAPTGVSTQNFVEGSLISDLELDQANVLWYITYSDSQEGLNQLIPSMPLISGTTYYGVLIGANGCPSFPFAVTVDVQLSNNDFEKANLSYYPNPVTDILNINYSENIIQVFIFNLSGQMIKSLNTNSNHIEIDMSDLSSGIYFVQLKTSNKEQFVKIIKE